MIRPHACGPKATGGCTGVAPRRWPRGRMTSGRKLPSLTVRSVTWLTQRNTALCASLRRFIVAAILHDTKGRRGRWGEWRQSAWRRRRPMGRKGPSNLVNLAARVAAEVASAAPRNRAASESMTTRRTDCVASSWEANRSHGVRVSGRTRRVRTRHRGSVANRRQVGVEQDVEAVAVADLLQEDLVRERAAVHKVVALLEASQHVLQPPGRERVLGADVEGA